MWTGAGCVGNDFQLAGCLGVAYHLPGDDLRARDHQARIGIPQRALDDALVDQRHQLLHLLRRDHLDPAAEGAAGADPALALAHPFVIALAGVLDAADPRVAAALPEGVGAVPGRVDRHLVVHSVEATLAGIPGRAEQ